MLRIIHVRIRLELIVDVHDVQDIQQLTFILMQALDLHIENGPGVHGNTVVLLNVFGKAHLVTVLDLHELTLCFYVVRVHLELGKVRKIRDPVISDMIGNPAGKKRIRVQKEASLRNAVGLVIELLREHFVEVVQLLVL